MKHLIQYSLISFVMSLGNLCGQHISFQPLDEDVVKIPMRTCVTPDGKLLTASAENQIGFQSARLIVKQWNGQFWADYPSMFASPFQLGDDNKLAVCWHNGRIYAAGSFNNASDSMIGIVSWNGNKWEKTAGGISSDYAIHKDISIGDMVSFNNSLFVCGRFNLAANQPVHNFVILSNDKWMPVSTGLGTVNDLHVMNDTLYCAGKFKQVEGVVNGNIAAYSNNKWLSLPSPSTDEIVGIGNFGASICAFTQSAAYLKTGNGSGASWTRADKQWDFTIEVFGNTACYEGKLYVSGTFTDKLGVKSHLLSWDGKSWDILVRNSDVLPAGQKNYYIDARGSELLFSGRIISFFGKKVKHIVHLVPGKTIVSGRVYKDNDQDCSFGNMDMPLEGVIISLNNGAYYTSSDKDGFYSLALENSKTSNLKVFPADDLQALCQGDQFNIVTGARDSGMTRDFPLQKHGFLPPQQTLELYSSKGFKVRHGYSSDYTVAYKSGTGKFPIHIVLDYDERLHYENADVEPIEMGEGKIRWIIYKDTDIHIVFKSPVVISTGEYLSFNSSSSFGDTNSVATLRERLKQEVISAYDPNEKQCSDARITRKDRYLDYHVQFQNLGNDSAVNVYVVDTISNSLPMQFIRVLNYSHQDHYNISFKVRDHAIIWHFSDILLPPKSQAGDEASSGYLRFRAGLDPQLRVGDSITNQAHIYFDYQDAVHTNTVVSTIVENKPLDPLNERLQLELYPNPVVSQFTLDMYPYLMQEFNIYDAKGRQVYTNTLSSPSSIVSVNPGKLAAGVYVIRVIHTFGTISKQFVVTN